MIYIEVYFSTDLCQSTMQSLCCHPLQELKNVPLIHHYLVTSWRLEGFLLGFPPLNGVILAVCHNA